MSLLAVVLSAAAGALLLPAPRGIPAGGLPGGLAEDGPAARGRVRLGRGLVAGLAGVAVALLAVVDGLLVALSLIALASAGAVWVLVHRSRRARAAARRQADVVEVVEALAGELRSGQPLVSSLEQCAAMWPDLDPVVSTARLGADVPSALRRLAELPGAEGLRDVASAWQVAERSGAGLASVLSQVADSARAHQGVRHLVRGELASAQATARLVALLPLASLAMSTGVGGNPWRFLLGTAPGLVCLALGLVFAFAGLLWIDRIATAVLRRDRR